MRLAVIPARGGSKRIPRKNIRPFCGKPIISWSTAAALDSGCFDRVVISADEEEVEITRVSEAEVPFVRPAALSDDQTANRPVVQHAIRWQRDQDAASEEVCCIYATAPFVRAADIRQGLATLLDSDCDYAFSVTSFIFPIQRAAKIDAAGRVKMFHPDCARSRSQHLAGAHHGAAQFYWGRAGAWLRDEIMFKARARAVVLQRHRVQDIDTDEDWLRAEWRSRTMLADKGAMPCEGPPPPLMNGRGHSVTRP